MQDTGGVNFLRKLAFLKKQITLGDVGDSDDINAGAAVPRQEKQSGFLQGWQMGSQFDLGSSGSRPRLRDEFLDGLECFKSDDYAAALTLFRKADESAAVDDVYQNRYTSFHGLARLTMGDDSGVKLCRKAAVGETNDAEVYYNLAMAENKLGLRESAYQALRRGLYVAPEHAGLLQLKSDIGLREKRGLVAGLRRNNWLNRLLGRLIRGSRQPYSDRE